MGIKAIWKNDVVSYFIITYSLILQQCHDLAIKMQYVNAAIDDIQYNEYWF